MCYHVKFYSRRVSINRNSSAHSGTYIQMFAGIMVIVRSVKLLILMLMMSRSSNSIFVRTEHNIAAANYFSTNFYYS